jgi:hypothetical protein
MLCGGVVRVDTKLIQNYGLKIYNYPSFTSKLFANSSSNMSFWSISVISVEYGVRFFRSL